VKTLRSLLRLLLMATAAVTLSACGIMILKGDPHWDPPTLAKAGCPDIEGKYMDEEMSPYPLLKDFFPYRPTSGETSPIRRIHPPHTTQIGFAPPTKGVGFSRGMKMPRKKTVVQFKKAGQFIEVRAMNPDGKLRSEYVLDLEHPWVGCRDGALVIRRWVTYPIGAGPCGGSRADETEYRKLPDGSLQLKRHVKLWSCSMYSESKRSSTTSTFPAAK
jgi:hypothetical protein